MARKVNKAESCEKLIALFYDTNKNFLYVIPLGIRKHYFLMNYGYLIFLPGIMIYTLEENKKFMVVMLCHILSSSFIDSDSE